MAYFSGGELLNFREGYVSFSFCACCVSDSSFDFVDMDQLLPQTNRILPTIKKLPCFLFPKGCMYGIFAYIWLIL